MKRFTGIYSLSNTLRFELKPIGKTPENIKKNGLLEQDIHRAESYVKVKKIIDRYHKAFIEEALYNFQLKYESTDNKDSLAEFFYYYKLSNKNDVQKKAFEEVQKNLRKQIVKQLKDQDKYKTIDKKELIKQDLLNFVNEEDDINLIKEFSEFTTYFKGFHENRQNMYSYEDKSTAIAYRMIHENLPKFIDNMTIFAQVANTIISEKFTDLYANFEEYLNVTSIPELFELNYFSNVLTQTQIDVYNAIIGGKTLEDGTKIQGLNEYINLYNQQQKDKSTRLPKLKPLFKQILSDREAISWLPENFESDNELLETLEQCYQSFASSNEDDNSLFDKIKQLLSSLSEYDLNKIFIRNDLQLTDISQKMFGSWSVIQNALVQELKQTTPKKSKKETDEAYEERLTEVIKNLDSLSIETINTALNKTGVEEYKKSVCSYFSSLGTYNNSEVDVFTQITKTYSEVKDLLNTEYSTSNNLVQDSTSIEKIKNLLDAIKQLQHFIKPLCGKGNEADKDERFYAEFFAVWEMLDNVTPLYNKVRNYLTKKPYSVEKIKLNFENSTLMDGWDLNKERDNTSVILRKDGLYYLAIMNKKHNTVFDEKFLVSDGDCYEKMEYKQIADASKDIQNIVCCNGEYKRFTKNLDDIKNYNIPHIYAIKQKESYLQDKPKSDSNKFSRKDLNTFIDYYKEAAIHYWNWCDFSFKKTEEYRNWKDFTNHVGMQGYKITFRKVSVDYIGSLVDEGKIYLFQIYNKDFSPYSKGTPNMHTLYWKMLFDEKNLADVVYKLNGQAEVFFRKSSIKYDKPTHPANQQIENKNPLNKKKYSTFKFDLIKDKRYTVDKFQFHVPITLNFKSTGSDNINQKVNEYIQNVEDLHVIGIDRGERHLLYLTVVDMNGEIKEQFSLNEIINEYKGNTYKVNYHDLLERREKERDEERKSWKTIENIKELKEGYLSQVIHKITTLMIKYNAIVVLEDLNMGFMRGRQKVEKAVYQKFEKMLIDKLNYLADKSKKPEEVGGVLNAYQLANKFVSFQKMGKQSGFLFYTQAWNTSKIDPTTGFVNLFDTRYENVAKAQAFFKKFDDIRYNSSKGWFEFEFDYNNFTTKAEGTKTKWTICTYGERIERFVDKNSQWDSIDINLSEKFEEFFASYGIDINSNLKQVIVAQNKKDFFEGLLHLLKLTLQMRNSHTGTEVDYMQSPVMNSKGLFYNSNECDITLPKNADANGAYNIARKGIMIVNRIKETADLKKLKLAISNKEWLEFAQK